MTTIDRSEVLSQAVARFSGLDGGFPGRGKPRTAEWLSSLRLPTPTPPSIDFWETQELRRSVHGYRDQPLDLADVVAVCQSAYDPQAEVDVWLVARDVAGLQPGLYEFDGQVLGLLESVPAESSRREEWFLQREFAACPAVLIFLSSVAACQGSMHAYRQMMVQAGEQCQDAALAAVGVGLGGVIFAGLLMVGLLDLGVDGYRRTGMVGYAFGHPLMPQSS